MNLITTLLMSFIIKIVLNISLLLLNHLNKIVLLKERINLNRKNKSLQDIACTMLNEHAIL